VIFISEASGCTIRALAFCAPLYKDDLLVGIYSERYLASNVLFMTF